MCGRHETKTVKGKQMRTRIVLKSFDELSFPVVFGETQASRRVGPNQPAPTENVFQQPLLRPSRPTPVEPAARTCSSLVVRLKNRPPIRIPLDDL